MPIKTSSPWQGIDVAACCRYAVSRQTREGGFCYYAHPEWGVEEPNAPDTRAAIAILQLLHFPLPNAEKCMDWLKAQQDPAGGYPTYLIAHATLWALRLLRVDPLRDPRPFLQDWARTLRISDRGEPMSPGWLASALQWAELWQKYGDHVAADMGQEIARALGRLHSAEGGYGVAGSNLRDTDAALQLMIKADLPWSGEFLVYARSCENPPHGFNSMPSARSSSLENQHAGMRILHSFAARPRYPDLVRGYVQSCQTPDGGFGRAPGAIPQLTETRLALQVLLMLAPA